METLYQNGWHIYSTLLKGDVLGQFVHLVSWYHAEFCPASILVYPCDLVNPTVTAVVVITTVTCITCEAPTAMGYTCFILDNLIVVR